MANTGTLLIATAAALWGISGGISGLLIAHSWQPMLIAFCRGLIGACMLALWWFLRRPAGMRPTPAMIGWSLVAGLGVAGNLTLYCVSIARTNVAIAATLLYTAPVYVYLAACLLGLDRLRIGRCLSLAVVLGGVVLLTDVIHAGPEQMSWPGVLAGLGGGASYALFIFGFQFARRHGSAPDVLLLAFVTFVVVLAPWVGLAAAARALSSPSLGLLVALGFAGAGLSFPLYLAGLTRASPVLASLVAMVEPVTAAAFGVTLLGDSLRATQFVGMAMVITTVTLLSLRPAPG